MGKKSKRTRTKQTPEEIKKINVAKTEFNLLSAHAGHARNGLRSVGVQAMEKSRWGQHLIDVINRKVDKILNPSENGDINRIR